MDALFTNPRDGVVVQGCTVHEAKGRSSGKRMYRFRTRGWSSGTSMHHLRT